MSHTPGPWNAHHADGRWVIDGPFVGVDEGEGSPTLWLVAKTATNDDMDEANARLIAAAPDLLEALKEVCTAVVDNCLDPVDRQRISVALGMADAAIGKAEGKS